MSSNMSTLIEGQAQDGSVSSSPSQYVSKPFRFNVEGNTFYLHTSLVSRHSGTLDVMMNGNMEEAQNGVAHLKDVDKDTFARFAEWIYQEYYAPGEVICRGKDQAEIEKSVSNSGGCESGGPNVGEERAVVDPPGHAGDRPRKKFIVQRTRGLFSGNESTRDHPSSTRERLKESFIRRKPSIRHNSIKVPTTRPNEDSNEDYTNVFLSHAKLYTFADLYDIPTLRTLALENLHHALSIFILHEQRTGDIIALFRYFYPGPGELDKGTAEVRQLLIEYMSFEIDTLMKDKEFRRLLIDNNDLLMDDFSDAFQKRVG